MIPAAGECWVLQGDKQGIISPLRTLLQSIDLFRHFFSRTAPVFVVPAGNQYGVLASGQQRW